MKFSQALIFIACAPSAIAMQHAGFGRMGAQVAAHETRKTKITRVMEIMKDFTEKQAQNELIEHNWDLSKTINFLTSSGNDHQAEQQQANHDPAPSRQPQKSSRSRMDRMNEGVGTPPPKKIGEPSHSELDDEPTLSQRNELEAPTNEEKQKENSNEDDLELQHEESEEDGKTKVTYERDSIMNCVEGTCYKLGNVLGGGVVQGICEYITKMIECPCVTCGYLATACFTKCWGAVEEGCACDPELRLVGSGFEMESLRVWLKESQHATWKYLGSCTTAICKTSWFCAKHCAIGTCSCTRRNRIICLPCNAYDRCKKRYEKGITRHECHSGYGSACDKGCAKIADCLVCCYDITGCVTDYFMCCCHALVEKGGNIFEAEGCRVFCELCTVCSACDGITI